RTFGCERYADAVRRIKRTGSELRSLPMTSSHNLESCTPGPISDLPSPTRGGRRMRESCTYGVVRGALSNERPYRDRPQTGDWPWSLRGAGLARLSPSRNTVHRRLRIPGLGARNHFPLRSSLHQNLQESCYSLKLSAEGIRHCGLNGTFQIRLRPSEED